MTLVARMGRVSQLDEGSNGHFSNMESLGVPPKWARYTLQCKNLVLREAISYAVIIYSSLGMGEEAFTGVINIFEAQLC